MIITAKSSQSSENSIHSVYIPQSNPKKLTTFDARNTAPAPSFVVSEKNAVVDLACLVVRGNPRNAVGVDVEFPPVPYYAPAKPLNIRARGKKDYNQEERLQYRHEKRSILYKSMVTAGKILPDWVNKKGEKRRNRVSLCRRFMHTHENAESFVTLSVDENHTARYKNLIHCDDPWCCPVCSANLLDQKAKEITQVQKNFLKRGEGKNWSTWMLTLTIPHTRQDKLDDLMTKKSQVMSDLHAHSAIKKLKARIGWQGYVDSSEIRYSQANGWHPHHHLLNFCTNMHLNTRVQCVYDKKRDYYRIATQNDKKRGLQLHKIEVQKYIYHVFAYLCVKHGLKRPSEDHGVDFKKSDDIKDYLTKQSKIAHELTSEYNKKSDYSRSQWEILRDCEEVKDNDDIDSLHRVLHSRALFVEFAKAVKGRAKIHWSPNFKEQYLDDEDEKGLADESENETKYIISLKLWNRFFTFSDRVEQRELLEKAEQDSLFGTNETEKRLLELEQILKDEEDREYQKLLERVGITGGKFTFNELFSDLANAHNFVNST